MGACARNMQSDSAEIKPAQCCIKLVFHLTIFRSLVFLKRKCAFHFHVSLPLPHGSVYHQTFLDNSSYFIRPLWLRQIRILLVRVQSQIVGAVSADHSDCYADSMAEKLCSEFRLKHETFLLYTAPQRPQSLLNQKCFHAVNMSGSKPYFSLPFFTKFQNAPIFIFCPHIRFRGVKKNKFPLPYEEWQK